MLDRKHFPVTTDLTRRAFARTAATAAVLTGAAQLAACGAAGGPTAPALVKPAQGHIEFWALAAPMLDTFIKEFNDKNPGAQATFTTQGDWVTLFQKLYAAIAGDTGPDLVRVKEYNAIDLGANKSLQPLDPYIKADKTFKADAFTPEQWKTANFDGAQYGVPFYNSIHVLLWNKPLFSQVGLNPDKGPQSWIEFRDAARKIAKPDQ